MELGQIHARLRPHAPALAPGLVLVALMLVWAIHNGGYDADTWYWGALLSLALLAAALIGFGARRPRLSRPAVAALVLFALYVAWSYLSITWAQSKGDALQGSNRALLYLVVFSLALALPWTPRGALLALLAFVLGVGVIAMVLLVRLAADDHVAALVIDGRLAAPTGYFNSTAALFTIEALSAIALAARRELPGLLRGVLIAFAVAGLQLALIVQSRGWLFTLPLVAIFTIVVVHDRIRFAATAVVPLLAALVPVRRLLDVYKAYSGPELGHAAARAGQAGLVACGVALVAGTLLAWGDSLVRLPPLRPARRRLIGGGLVTMAIAAGGVAGVVVTHGHPFKFISRQWNGFSQPQTSGGGSHFTDIGSGRYDFWRVALDAALAHPIGGLGQDNFGDYYLPRRRTPEEPEWTHSLEMRLLAHTGFVGFALFAGFVAAAIAAALRARRGDDAISRSVAAVALLPLTVWLIHGSVDWFWEIPALTGPALAFLGMAGALGRQAGALDTQAQAPDAATLPRPALPSIPRAVALAGAALGLLAAVIVLAFPYFSVREVSLAADVRGRDPAAALRDLGRAARLNPLSADPGRLGGAIALQTGQYQVAQQRFSQAVAREPGGWFSWLGAGLAASALGDRTRAHRDFVMAFSINSQQPADRQALARVYTRNPLTPTQAFSMLVLAR